jgi:hypothetical protein
VAALQANQELDPKYAQVRKLLVTQGWLEMGCIVFSQYRDSIQWLAIIIFIQLGLTSMFFKYSKAAGFLVLGFIHESTTTQPLCPTCKSIHSP